MLSEKYDSKIATIMSFLAMPGNSLYTIENIVRELGDVTSALGYSTTSEAINILFQGLYTIAQDWQFLWNVVVNINSYINRTYGKTLDKIFHTRDMVLKVYKDVMIAKEMYNNLKKLKDVTDKAKTISVLKDIASITNMPSLKILAKVLESDNTLLQSSDGILKKETIELINNSIRNLLEHKNITLEKRAGSNPRNPQTNVKVTLKEFEGIKDRALTSILLSPRGNLKTLGSIYGYIDKDGISINLKHNLAEVGEKGMVTRAIGFFSGIFEKMYSAVDDVFQTTKPAMSSVKSLPLALVGTERLSISLKFYIVNLTGGAMDTLQELLENSIPGNYTSSLRKSIWVYPIMLDVVVYNKIYFYDFVLESVSANITPPFVGKKGVIEPAIIPITITGKARTIVTRDKIREIMGVAGGTGNGGSS